MIYRIDVQTRPMGESGSGDAVGEALRHQIAALGMQVGPISTRRIYLIDSDADAPQIQRIAKELLADPIVESAEVIGTSSRNREIPDPRQSRGLSQSRIEVHLKPGVMDPVAASTEMAIRDMRIPVREVRTGRAFLFEGEVPRDELERIARKVLANGVIEAVHFDRHIPNEFPRGRVTPFKLRHVPVLNLSDGELQKLSRDGHLFLSLEEMRAVQAHFKTLDREPTDAELETIAQTWSEHCVHKTLKSAVEVVDESGRVVRRYGNLIKETIFSATKELMNRVSGPGFRVSDENAITSHPKPEPRNPKPDFCLSVFKDNAGVIAFDETDAVCFKVETHNHPSAIEPYGGSATGIGGCIRDILGTGLSAKPIANTDVFCVAYPDDANAERPTPNADPTVHSAFRIPHSALPAGIIHPRRILQQVVAGVRDYGNRMGIPTVNGAVYFDDRYVGNPLVFCGCVGLIPRDKVQKQVIAGDAIVLMGGRTGRDGIHGATFSSAELTDTHADEFSHAVQIGNAITQKKMADVILRARDLNLFNAITDLGAGGLSSAIGEMGESVGATVELDRVPLKYAGLRYDEIWISEAQERMALSAPAEKVDALLELARSEDVEATVIGRFGTPKRELILNFEQTEVARLSMEFLHDGLPMPTRKAIVRNAERGIRNAEQNSISRSAFHIPRSSTPREHLLSLLAHPNIASKHWIIRQYDHEVQGGSVIKPLIGPLQIGPSDAAVVRPKLDSFRGVALSCGLSPQIEDPYAMAVAAIDEAVRNAVAIGADPAKLAILDNFCWPSVDDEQTMGTLVRACEACRDASLAFGIPFISGKDSLHNQFTDRTTGKVIRIPNTLLISAIGVIEDVRKCVTMDFKQAGAPIYLIAAKKADEFQSLINTHRALAALIAEGHIAACHDVSDGGYATAAAEMAIASGIGVSLDPDLFTSNDPFAESNGRYIIEPRESAFELALNGDLAKRLAPAAELIQLGFTQRRTDFLLINSRMANASQKVDVMISLDELTAAWRRTLDW